MDKSPTSDIDLGSTSLNILKNEKKFKGILQKFTFFNFGGIGKDNIIHCNVQARFHFIPKNRW
jgi:hypothetical protein